MKHGNEVKINYVINLKIEALRFQRDSNKNYNKMEKHLRNQWKYIKKYEKGVKKNQQLNDAESLVEYSKNIAIISQMENIYYSYEYDYKKQKAEIENYISSINSTNFFDTRIEQLKLSSEPRALTVDDDVSKYIEMPKMTKKKEELMNKISDSCHHFNAKYNEITSLLVNLDNAVQNFYIDDYNQNLQVDYKIERGILSNEKEKISKELIELKAKVSNKDSENIAYYNRIIKRKERKIEAIEGELEVIRIVRMEYESIDLEKEMGEPNVTQEESGEFNFTQEKVESKEEFISDVDSQKQIGILESFVCSFNSIEKSCIDSKTTTVNYFNFIEMAMPVF
ncbi:MAG: hypothetical protein ACTH64_07445 [Providencia sp.]